MSDSDDTDILLLIPPDYFISSAERKLQPQLRQQRLARSSRQRIVAMGDVDALVRATPAPTAAYEFLALNRKVELNHINSRLHNLQHEENMHQECFVAPSDISTISNCTVRTTQHKQKHATNGFVHSTPKCVTLNERNVDNAARIYREDGVLLEIDNFLEDQCNERGVQWNHYSDDYTERRHHLENQESQAISLPEMMNHLPEDHATHMQLKPNEKRRVAVNDNNLISLSEIWGKSGQDTAIASGPKTTLKEEQLRRQHLEKTVRLLQGRLLEYQQRLSVAIEVDRAKDAALCNAQKECKSWTLELQQLRDINFKSELMQNSYISKLDALQKELAQAMSLATTSQEKNEKLENELSTCLRKTNECNNLYKQQLDDLEIKMHALKHSEESANNEMNKLKDRFVKAEYQNDKLKLRCDEIEKECTLLRHQKETLQEFHKKQKSRADDLEMQRTSLQESLGHLTQTETTLKKKLDIQQKSLKSHYQQQLENVVARKLKEFQEQLDSSEESLKTEARERERLIAERAVKQLELINEKNELELNLLQEKHNEEVELYRIQLANASKKIDDLEMNLQNYKTKRADIAEKLHDVMETQWQKALEILTSPNQLKQIQTDTDNESVDNNATNNQFETPKNGKLKKTTSKENNLNVISSKIQGSSPPMDRLQAYIELLLSKSPSDFNKLDEILALSTNKGKSTAGKLEKDIRRTKPPWKA